LSDLRTNDRQSCVCANAVQSKKLRKEKFISNNLQVTSCDWKRSTTLLFLD
jgi:hypothetical protein